MELSEETKQLFRAVFDNNSAMVEKLLKDGRANPAADNNSAILYSAEKGHDKVVKLLLEDGRADPADNDNYAIRLSTRNGHEKVVKLLLEDGRADPTDDDNSAIISSAENGHDKVVKLLLEDGRADPADDYNSAIRLSAEFKHDKVVKLLLEDGRADPADDDNYAIRLSTRNGHLEVVKLLLEDERVDPTDDDNYAIRLSAENGHLEVVKLLLEDGRVDPADDDNYAILTSAENWELEVVNVLIASFFINKVLVENHYKIYMEYNNRTSTWKSFRAVTSQHIQLTTVLQYFETLQRTFKNVFQTEEDQQTLPYLLHFSHKQLLDTKKYQKAGKDRERQIRNIAFTYFFMVQYSLIQLKKGEITSIYDNAEQWSFHYAKQILLNQWLRNGYGASYSSRNFLIQEFNKLKEKKGLEYKEAIRRLARIMSIKYEKYLFEKIKAKLFPKPTETQNNLQPRRKKVKLEKTEDKTRRPQTVPEMLPDWIDLNLKQRLKF